MILGLDSYLVENVLSPGLELLHGMEPLSFASFSNKFGS